MKTQNGLNVRKRNYSVVSYDNSWEEFDIGHSVVMFKMVVGV